MRQDRADFSTDFHIRILVSSEPYVYFSNSHSPIRKGRDSGQFLSLQKLEGGAASRRNKKLCCLRFSSLNPVRG